VWFIEMGMALARGREGGREGKGGGEGGEGRREGEEEEEGVGSIVSSLEIKFLLPG
jgi:hypothetical protein